MPKSFGHHISAISRQIQVHLNREFRPFGIGSGQYLYFSYISRNEGITQKELSEMVAVDKATTAKAVKKLVAQGYVRTQPHPEDRRSSRLFLSDRGRETVPAVREILAGTTAILARGFSEEEKERILGDLEKIFYNIRAKNRGGRNG